MGPAQVVADVAADVAADVVADARAVPGAVWAADPRAACIVGPTRFYNRYHLGPEYLMEPGRPTIYAANFFEPGLWIGGQGAAAALPYGATARCCDLAEEKSCGGSCDGGGGTVTLGRAWLASLLQPVLDFRAKYDVPVWVDQWGLDAGASDGDASRAAYLDVARAPRRRRRPLDVLDLALGVPHARHERGDLLRACRERHVRAVRHRRREVARVALKKECAARAPPRCSPAPPRVSRPPRRVYLQSCPFQSLRVAHLERPESSGRRTVDEAV